MEVHVHRAHRDDERGDVTTMQSIVSQERLQFFVHGLVFHVREGRKQKAASPASWVGHCLTDAWLDDIHNGIDERTRCEVLSRPALLILTVFLKDAFVECPLQVTVHQEPLLLIDKGDKLLKIHSAFDSVGRFREDRTDETRTTAQHIERTFVLVEQVFTGFLE